MKKRAKALISFIFVSVALFLFLTIDTSHAFLGKGIFYLPYTISSPGTYYVMKDLKCPPGGHGITVRADNVTLDLMGFSLIGPGGTGGDFNGIYMNGRKNVEIRNGTVRGFWCGIYAINEGRGYRIINVRTTNNARTGISIEGGGHLVERCTAGANVEHGIFVSADSTIISNTCYENGKTGIVTGSNSTATGNTCSGNHVDGIEAAFSTVIGNTCNDNIAYGLHLVGCNLVDQNTAYGNGTNMQGDICCAFGTNCAP